MAPLAALQAFDEKTPSLGDICPMERAIIFGIQDRGLGLLPLTTRATEGSATRGKRSTAT